MTGKPSPRGRPAGEVRQALRQAAASLAASAEGCTWRDAALAARVGFAAARRTMANMASAGELERVGTRQVPGVCRPMTLYAPAERARRASFALGAPLAQVLASWRR